MQTLRQDLAYGLRMLRKNPGFTLVIVLILAFGIGANSSIFSLINTVLLSPLPYSGADRLVVVKEERPAQKDQELMASGPEFIAWSEQNTVFEQTAAMTYASLNITGGAEPESLLAAKVSPGFLSVMGVRPQIGRFFLPEEDTPGSNPVVLLSNALWQRRFGSDPGLIGNAITLSDRHYTVVGVMPSGFQFPPAPPGMAGPDLWVPIAAPLRQLAGLHNLYVVARLKPGVSIKQAQSDISTIASRLEERFPDSNTGHGVKVVSLHEQLVGDAKPALLVLAAAVAFVLLIACANVTNLLLARAASRQKEVSIRMALGASRIRVLRQLLTESILLGLIGGGVGLLFAFWIVEGFPAISPADLRSISRVAIDPRVLTVTFGISLFAGLISGIAPAIRGTGASLDEGLKETTRTSAGIGRRRLRNILVMAEIAVALVLLIGAGLMIRSFARLTSVSAGFNPSNVVAFDLSLPGGRYPKPDQQRAFFDQLCARAGLLPGVQSVGATNCLPLSGAQDRAPFSIEGRAEPGPGEEMRAGLRVVSAGYFSALQVPLLDGRFFEEADARVAVPLIRWFPAQPNPAGFEKPQAPPCAIINATMAATYWPNETPIGHRIRVLFSPWLTIVGVVGDVKHSGLDSSATPEVYLSDVQEPRAAMTLLVRATSGDPTVLTGAIRNEVQALDKDEPFGRITTMSRVFSDSVSKPRFNTLLLAVFGALSLGLAAIGIFAVISYSVQQRAHEIGVRMALGARPQSVFRLIVGEGLIFTAAGIAAGLCASLALTSLISGLLFAVSPHDPLTFVAVSVFLGIVALSATYLPARRATRVDPVTALRCE